MGTFIGVVLAASAFYFFVAAWFLKTNNAKSWVVFKFIPFAIAMASAFCTLYQFGFIIKV